MNVYSELMSARRFLFCASICYTVTGDVLKILFVSERMMVGWTQFYFQLDWTSLEIFKE